MKTPLADMKWLPELGKYVASRYSNVSKELQFIYDRKPKLDTPHTQGGSGILISASRNFLQVRPLDMLMCRCGSLRLVSLLRVTYSGRSPARDSCTCFDSSGLSMLLMNSQMKSTSDFGGLVLYLSRKAK